MCNWTEGCNHIKTTIIYTYSSYFSPTTDLKDKMNIDLETIFLMSQFQKETIDADYTKSVSDIKPEGTRKDGSGTVYLKTEMIYSL